MIGGIVFFDVKYVNLVHHVNHRIIYVAHWFCCFLVRWGEEAEILCPGFRFGLLNHIATSIRNVLMV